MRACCGSGGTPGRVGAQTAARMEARAWPRDEWADFARDVLSGFEGRHHMSPNHVITFTGDDEATTEIRNSSFDTEDYAEGVRAFLAKRTPEFRWS